MKMNIYTYDMNRLEPLKGNSSSCSNNKVAH